MKPHPYASHDYAKAFAQSLEFIFLEEAKIFVVKRPIPGTSFYDAVGCYPLSPISETGNLGKDFIKLKEHNIISLVLVTDPFFSPAQDQLRDFFDHVVKFKEHYLCDLSGNNEYSSHHRYEIRKALKSLEVRKIDFKDYIVEWNKLYQNLIDKHGIKGVQAFSKEYFLELQNINPLMFGAFSDGTLVSAHLWFEHSDYAYSHLAASNEIGYKLSAAYPLIDASLKYFRESGVKMVDLGGDSGTTDLKGKLAFFKKGFSNMSKFCYLCGKIIDKSIYDKLSSGIDTNYFPAYRA